MARDWKILADSARPETISYMQKHGYPRIEPAKKGPGSVEEGVAFLQSYNEIVIHPRCTHTAEEFVDYRYKVHPLTGDVTPVLEDKKNHVIDSVRYATEGLREPNEFITW
jgi:phage terminase large subunit